MCNICELYVGLLFLIGHTYLSYNLTMFVVKKKTTMKYVTMKLVWD